MLSLAAEGSSLYSTSRAWCLSVVLREGCELRGIGVEEANERIESAREMAADAEREVDSRDSLESGENKMENGIDEI